MPSLPPSLEIVANDFAHHLYTTCPSAYTIDKLAIG